MPSLHSVLNTASQSLQAQRQGVAATAQNISNVNTEGYSRTRVNLVSNTNPENGLGTGVKVENIEAMRDSFVEKKLLDEESQYGKYTAQAQIMQQIEPSYDESFGQGIDKSLTEFFNSWRQLSNNPMGTAERANVKSKGELVVEQFNRAHNNLTSVQNGLSADIESKITAANNLAEEISTLNKLIRQSEVDETQQANDFRDKRQVLLRELAQIIGINSFESSGHTNVLVASGLSLVDGVRAGKFVLDNDKVYFTDPDQISKEDVTSKISKGSLGGLLEMRDQTITELKDNLDKMAFKLSGETDPESFNNLHKQGYGDNNQTGIIFFKTYADPINSAKTPPYGAAEQLKLSDEIELSIANIATSTTLGERGNNEHALELASFQDKKLTFTRGTESFNLTLADMYRADVSTVAVKTKKSIEFAEFEENIMQQLENFRESVSGVSIDSELTNMMAFQKAFEASARVVRVVDSLTDSIISLAG